MTVTAYNICPKGIVCTNATHFKLCVDHGNGSVHVLDKPTACPYNTVCNASQCLDIFSVGSPTPNARRCSVHGFICTSNYEYQLCKYDQQGLSYPWGQNYDCPQNTVCNETYFYHCQTHYTSSHVPGTAGHLPSSTKDECKSKNFVCVESNTYLLCRDMGDGNFKPYGQQYKCPSTHVCHKSFDKPCAVVKSTGNNLYVKNFFGFLIPVCSVLLINYI
jgi:hypothetical protein